MQETLKEQVCKCPVVRVMMHLRGPLWLDSGDRDWAHQRFRDLGFYPEKSGTSLISFKIGSGLILSNVSSIEFLKQPCYFALFYVKQFFRPQFILSKYKPQYQFSSVHFSLSVVSDSLRPHESQHARPPCPSPTPEYKKMFDITSNQNCKIKQDTFVHLSHQGKLK